MNNKDKAFIAFNNRSVALVMRFLDRTMHARKLVDLEADITEISSKYSQGRTIEIDATEFVETFADPSYGPEDVEACGSALSAANVDLLAGCPEMDWLQSRKIGLDVVGKYGIGRLASIPTEMLETIGATCHPALANLLNTEIGPGVVIPLWEGGRLINVTVRRIDDLGKLKYTQACPDVSVWGLGSVVSGKPVWMVEGLFDMMAMHSIGESACSVSGAMWSGPQLYYLLRKLAEAEPSEVRILADNDQPGLRCARILCEILKLYGVLASTWLANGKDAAEHVFEMGMGTAEMSKTEITDVMVASAADTSFNFTNYLKSRKF